MDRDRLMELTGRYRYRIIGIIAVIGIGVVAGLPAGTSTGDPGMDGTRDPSTSDAAANYTDWQDAPLEAVSDGERFTITDLRRPVLIESFAVWCTTCTRQQQEIQRYLRDGGATVVSLNVDPNEDAQIIRDHRDRYGFSWRYAVAPSRMTRLLVDAFGSTVVHPPAAPMVLICENGTRHLDPGVKPADRLASEVASGC